jgi:hypothetical protein
VILAPPFFHDEGNCWGTRLPPHLVAVSDGPGFRDRSRAQLLEAGAPIGLPHALHDAIRKVGLGAHSHWADTLYFSTSDNSDPNSNGRTYRLVTTGRAMRADGEVPAETIALPQLSTEDLASVSSLADILRRQEVREVVYFHADHFEPWAGRTDDQRWRGLERFRDSSRRNRFAQRLTLFYTPRLMHLPADRAGPDDYRNGDDPVAFRRLPQEFLDRCRELVRPLEAEVGHQFQIHVHHEGWTRTSVEHGELSALVNASGSADSDSRRLEYYLKLCKETLQAEIGRPFDKWAFVHGNWSLNASDPRSCQIEDEIALMMRLGCYGDFTFPAGQPHCDPTVLQAPYTCWPHVGVKSYDRPQAEALPLTRGANHLSQGRFLIWNSPIKATHSSLDFFHEPNARLLAEREALVATWLRQGVVIDGRLYIKTHAHSMNTKYRPWEDGYFPHDHPDAISTFELLLKACDAAAIPLLLSTVDEVMERLREFDRTPPDLPEAAPARPPIAVAETLPANLKQLAPLVECLFEGMVELRGPSTDPFYASRIERQTVLESYEIATIAYLLRDFPPAEVRIIEVGIGWGMLSVCLAALGYEVVGFVGQSDHAKAARSLSARADGVMPGAAARLRIVEGMFPADFTPDDLHEDRRNVMIATNIVHNYSAQNQMAIADAGLLFDKVLLDLGAFGVSREREERRQLGDLLAGMFDIVDTILEGRYVEIKVMEPRSRANRGASAADGEAAGSLGDTILQVRPPFVHRGGYGWSARLPPELEQDADNGQARKRSNWFLLEDGQQLPLPHTTHREIVALGAGRYSHWQNQLYFSTSDNSDPNVNGRKYSLRRTLSRHPQVVAGPNSPSADATSCAGLIAIYGASFSGSTLVNAVLGSHPEIFGGGELHWLTKESDSTVCAICRSACRFWTPDARRETRIEQIYHQVSRRFGRRFVVDISKMREWYDEVLPHFPDLPVFRVLLVKHPVRHVSSFIEKKETAGTLSDGTPAYVTPKRTLQRLRAFYEGFLLPGESEIDVRYKHVEKPTQIDLLLRYEDFVASPVDALRPILEKFGLQHDEKMTDWAQAEHHHIGGNIGPRVQINNDTPALETAARKYRQRGIFLDNSFAEILDLEGIEDALRDPDALWIRERFGYPIREKAAHSSTPVDEGDSEAERIMLERPFAREQGHCWVVSLPVHLLSQADDAGDNYKSPWRLLESDVPIGVPHSLHTVIRASGGGMHSHWKSQLLFSTGDNTDPNTNGRDYALVRRAPVSRQHPRPPAGPSDGPARTEHGASPTSKLADILKRRQVTEVVYFHTDHFEPWDTIFEEGIRLIDHFASLSARSRHGRKLNLFYTPPVVYDFRPDPSSDGRRERRIPGDGFVFESLSDKQADIHRNAIGKLVELGHEFHLHIHHTLWTRTCGGDQSSRLNEWLQGHSSPALDSQRLNLFTRLACECITAATGRPFARWAFIHGLWALNASDPTACMVEDEISILMRHGCVADFTFPAGRAHCDPTVSEVPYTCLPVIGPKSYDSPAADPRPVIRGGKHFRPGRFLIWNSPIKAMHSSIDHYDPSNRERLKQAETLVAQWLQRSVLLDGVLYVKTHSHSLAHDYKVGTPDGQPPHSHPDVVALFDLLERTCDAAKVPFHIATVSEVMERLLAWDQVEA